MTNEGKKYYKTISQSRDKFLLNVVYAESRYVIARKNRLTRRTLFFLYSFFFSVGSKGYGRRRKSKKNTASFATSRARSGKSAQHDLTNYFQRVHGPDSQGCRSPPVVARMYIFKNREQCYLPAAWPRLVSR